MATQQDKRFLKITDAGGTSYVCISKITTINAIPTGCVIHMLDDAKPLRVMGISAEDIMQACGFDIVQAQKE